MLLAPALIAWGVAITFGPAKPVANAVTLNTNVNFPYMSFGLQVYNDETASERTKIAIDTGVRNFFASVLAGNQKGFGKAVQASAVPREELFICGSVNTGSCRSAEDCYRATAAGCETNLKDLDLDYVDMIMLDYPSRANGCEGIVAQWMAFEDMLKSKKAKSLAVSNFSPAQLDCIVSNKSLTVPAVNQMPFSVGRWDKTLVDADASRGGIVVQAYSPLRSGQLLYDKDCKSIGQKYGKTAAQVALRWLVQHRVTFTTESSTAKHFREDLEIFDFVLTDKEMQRLDAK